MGAARGRFRVVLGALILVLLLLAQGTAVAATTITVNTTADELNSDGDCSLREAIQAANTDTAVDACPAGSGADTITFGVTGTITLTSGQLTVIGPLTIDGPGAASLTISGGGASRVLEVVGAVTVEDVTVADGSVIFGLGGGIRNFGTLVVANSTISGNSAPLGQGGGIFNNGTLTITNSTFSENNASPGSIGNGGGIANFGTLTVTNSTFSGNGNLASGGGGGIDNLGGTATITNSTFSENVGVPGGNIRNFATLSLQNTIVANGLSGGNCSGAITDGGGNLSWPDSTCPGINQDPLLDPAGLQDNGGPTKTIALQPGSAAIDAAVLANCPGTDQRGVTRPQGAGCDIGAFELVQNQPPSCASVAASPNRLWPPNHKLRLITLSGATDPDGDTVTLTITGVTQDEPVSGLGPDDVSPDAQTGTQSHTVFLRAERSDAGDGRVYRISFTGADGNGGTCSGTATVGVPKSRLSTPVDSAPPSYNSFGP
jgi:CSLREA domain-containing protein